MFLLSSSRKYTSRHVKWDMLKGIISAVQRHSVPLRITMVLPNLTTKLPDIYLRPRTKSQSTGRLAKIPHTKKG